MNARADVALEREFAAALLDPECAPPVGLATWNGSDPALRFAVHRNNVVVSLIDALAATFPVLRKSIGASDFAALARHFVRAHPPASPVLAEWGDAFAPWLAACEAMRGRRWLADLARLERARVRAFHAAVARALTPQRLASLHADPDLLSRVRFVLHPALHVFSSRFAVVTLWSAPQETDAAAAAPCVDRAESALVLRDAADDVLVIAVGAAEAAFVRALQRGCTLAAAAASGAARAPAAQPFDLAAALARLLGSGQLVGWRGDGVHR